MSEQPVTADTLRAEVERLLKASGRFDYGSTLPITLNILQPFLQQQAAVVAERDRLRRQVEGIRAMMTRAQSSFTQSAGYLSKSGSFEAAFLADRNAEHMGELLAELDRLSREEA